MFISTEPGSPRATTKKALHDLWRAFLFRLSELCVERIVEYRYIAMQVGVVPGAGAVELFPVVQIEGSFTDRHGHARLCVGARRLEVSPVRGAGVAVDVHLAVIPVVEEAHRRDAGDLAVATVSIRNSDDVDGQRVARRIVVLADERALV